MMYKTITRGHSINIITYDNILLGTVSIYYYQPRTRKYPCYKFKYYASSNFANTTKSFFNKNKAIRYILNEAQQLMIPIYK